MSPDDGHELEIPPPYVGNHRAAEPQSRNSLRRKAFGALFGKAAADRDRP
jgi:hypothetical protein